MRANRHVAARHTNDRAVSVLIVAVGMVFILAMAGLAIDLASLYVARSQAQRSADAAALAGANSFRDNNCVSGSAGSISSACQTLAIQRAEIIGNSNLIAGVSPAITDADITFPSTSTSDPQIQVVAGRGTYNGTNHNNALPTFFMKIFGITTASISAKATAEAVNPADSLAPVGSTCVKPWLFPNCDSSRPSVPSGSSTANLNCPDGTGNYYQMFVNPSTSPPTIEYDTYAGSGGVVGEPFTAKPGSPGGAAAPGQYYAAYIPNDATAPTDCPACASATPTSGGTGSAAIYREDIECCNQNPVVCGSNSITLQSSAGNMVGPTSQGVDCLIHQSGGSWPSNCGQDYLTGTNTVSPCTNPNNLPLPNAPPFQVIAGPNNSYVTPGSTVSLSNSDSAVVVPIWDGVPLQSGQNPSINIVGFLELFVRDEGSPQGTVYTYITAVSACGSGGSGTGTTGGSGGTTIVAGGSSVPVRLIRQ